MKHSLKFSKMHGAGNDFVVVDDRELGWSRDPAFIRRVCDRRRGVGADGLILISDSLRPLESSDSAAMKSRFRMDFFNSDGGAAETCGNGLRCAALFTINRMEAARSILFETNAGESPAEVLSNGEVCVELPWRSGPERILLDSIEAYLVDTGVPHLVVMVDDVAKYDVESVGKKLRSHPALAPDGANVDFLEFTSDSEHTAFLRTFERGVEGETLACGTGAAAAAVCSILFQGKTTPLSFKTFGGDVLTVDFSSKGGIVAGMTLLSLTGPATEVCFGELQ
ncbi:MAG: diaminopimelate epimerase [Victivallales bacterium]|nr:diaminopimelate epimerase [Victivallales bacterium]